MSAPIRGMRPFDAGGNDYTHAHKAGRHFREKPTKPHLPPVKVTIDAEGYKTYTATVVLRKPRTPLDPAKMSDKQWLAHLARTILAPAKTPTRRRGRSVGGSGPTLLIRG